MNLALGAVLLAILLTPPLVVMYFFTRGAHSKGMPKLTLLEYLLLSATFSLLMHGAAVWLIRHALSQNDLGIAFLFRLLIGQLSEELLKANQGKLEGYLINFGIYVTGMSAVSAAFGLLLREAATSRRLRMTKWLQRKRKNLPPAGRNPYYGNWWYFFRANEYNSEYEYLGTKYPLVNIDVLVDTKDATVIYSGILLDFVLKGDDLDFIYMNTVRKRAFSENDSDSPGNSKLTEGKEIPITPGDGSLAIPFSKITNLYIQFVAPPAVHGKVSEDFYQMAMPVAVSEPSTNPIETKASSAAPHGSGFSQHPHKFFLIKVWLKLISRIFKKKQ